MSAKNRLNKFYNQEIKEAYLKTIESQVSRDFVENAFNRVEEEERQSNKDIYNMNLDELRGALSSLSCSSQVAVYNNLLIFEAYIDWAMENGHSYAKINPFMTILDKFGWSAHFVSEYKNRYYTREKIEDMIDELYNKADKSILLALFEGIRGVRFSELLNLEEKDIKEKDGKHFVQLTDDNKDIPRVIEISERLAELLVGTNEMKVYYNKNGQSTGGKRWEESVFVDSPKIYKKVTRGKQEGELTSFFISRKFDKTYKEVFDYKHLKAIHVIHSGIMDMAHRLQSNGVLTSESIHKIVKHYAVTNTTTVKRIVSQPDFEELYGYEMKYTYK